MNRPCDGRRVRRRPLGSEPLALAVRWDDPLAGSEAVGLGDLSRCDFVDRPAGSAIRLHIDAICAELGFQRSICAEADTPGALLDLVEAGFGIAFLPPTLLANSAQVVGVSTRPAITRDLGRRHPDRPTSVAGSRRLSATRGAAPIG